MKLKSAIKGHVYFSHAKIHYCKIISDICSKQYRADHMSNPIDYSKH